MSSKNKQNAKKGENNNETVSPADSYSANRAEKSKKKK